MATKKTPLTEDDALSIGEPADLDQAIGDLRGVLKTDAEGGFGDFGDFADTPATDAVDAMSFGGGSSDFGMDDFSAAPAAGAPMQIGSGLSDNLDLIMDIPNNLEIALGTSRTQVSGLMNLEEGATIALDKKIGEPVEITVNGRRIAKGEITVLEHDDTRFGVKLTEVLSTKTT